MSVLETPRIYFRGQVSWDTITTNNTPALYDENSAEPVFPQAVRKVAAFRREAIAAVATKGNWNPDGTHRATFFDCAISGADLGSGLVTNDPFVAAPANFLGMLVDLEPYGAFSSQLFFDAMSFGIDGGYRIALKRSTRFTDRYINFSRNPVGAIAGIASVVWQTSFPKADFRVDAFDSGVLQALQTALAPDDVLGLTVQWNAYRTIYYDDPKTVDKLTMAEKAGELILKLAGGGFQPNPARSVLVGVIGLWRAGEPIHEPLDRTLVTGPAAPPRPPTVASAHARVAGNAIVLDLSNSISETGLDLTKKDFGTLSVVAVDANGNATTLGSFDYAHYDKDAYEQTSGIVTVPITSAAATSGDLQLCDASGNVLLAESTLRAIPLAPNLYLNQGETKTAAFQVYDRGVAAGGGVPVQVCVMSADGNTIDSAFNLVTDDAGIVSFPIAATSGINAYVPLPGPNPQQPSQGLDPQVNTFMYARTLPADDDIAALPPTWENVYSRVLANWHAMAPCMDNWLDLGNEAQVKAYGPLIKRLTTDGAFEHFRYMPVTRDMTAGERTLLYNFLDGGDGAALAAAAPKETAAEEETMSFAELSRKMRSP